MDDNTSKIGSAVEFIEQGRFGEALVLYRELATSEKSEAAKRALLDASDLLINLRRHAEAQDTAELLLTICPEGGSQLWHARALGRLGTAIWFAAGPAASLPLSRRALAALRKANDAPTDELVRAIDNLGLALHSTNKYDEAIELQKHGLAIAEHAVLVDDARRIKRRLANTLQDKGLFVLAERMMVEIMPGLGASAQDRIGWYNASAMLAERRGRLREAVDNYQSALSAFDELEAKKQSDFAALLSNAALLFLDLGDEARVDRVISRLQGLVADGAPLSARIGYERLQGRMEEAVGNIVAAERHWANAARLVEAFAENDISRAAEFAAIRARLLMEVGDHAKAIEVLQPFDILKADGADHVHLIEATIERVRAAGASASFSDHREPLAVAFAAELERGDSEIGWRLLALLSDWTHDQGNHDAAIVLGKLAVRSIFAANMSLRGSNREQAAHWRARAQPQISLLDRLIAAERLPEAEQIMALVQIDRISTLARHRLHADQLSTALPLHEDERHLDQAYVASAQALQQAKANCVDPLVSSDQRTQAAIDIGAARLTGRKTFDALTNFRIATRRTTPVTVFFAETLPARKAVLRILSTTRAVIGIFRDHGSSQTYDIAADQAQFAREVQALRSALIGQEQNWQPQSKQLFDLIFGPIATRLSHLNSIEISASGAAQYIPFSCLHDGSQCLVERLAISVRSGASAIDRAQVPAAHWRVAAFGTATALGVLPALPHLRQEMASIKAAFPTAHQCIDAEFTRDALVKAMSSGVELLHIAAHYQLAAGAAHRSFLSLGDGSRISLIELADTEFDASRLELAVLSGCDTGTVDDGIGGAQSMAGVLQAKGARDVIAALWPIADAGAAKLMRSLYCHLTAVPPSGALRAAQMELLDGGGVSTGEAGGGVRGLGLVTGEPDFTHPCYWSGFAHMVPGR